MVLLQDANMDIMKTIQFIKLLFYNVFYISEIKEDNKRSVSSTLPAVIGGTLGACIILLVSAVLLMKR